MTNVEAVGEFLRARRALISPESVGFAVDVRPRRVPGLRREEVASLAGVSVDYYIKLERGHIRGVSRSVWAALARTLELDEVEKSYLYDLVAAETGVSERGTAFPKQRVSAGVLTMLNTMDEFPAMVQGRRLDVLAFNNLFGALYGGFAERPAGERNIARFAFLDPAAKDLYTKWNQVAHDIVAILRLYAGSHPNDPQLTELVEELSAQSDLFRRTWSEHRVVQHADGKKHFSHPIVGEMTLNYETFQATADPDQTLVIFHADPGSPSADALRLLGAWGATRSTAQRTGSFETSLDA